MKRETPYLELGAVGIFFEFLRRPGNGIVGVARSFLAGRSGLRSVVVTSGKTKGPNLYGFTDATDGEAVNLDKVELEVVHGVSTSAAARDRADMLIVFVQSSEVCEKVPFPQVDAIIPA